MRSQTDSAKHCLDTEWSAMDGHGTKTANEDGDGDGGDVAVAARTGQDDAHGVYDGVYGRVE